MISFRHTFVLAPETDAEGRARRSLHIHVDTRDAYFMCDVRHGLLSRQVFRQRTDVTNTIQTVKSKWRYTIEQTRRTLIVEFVSCMESQPRHLVISCKERLVVSDVSVRDINVTTLYNRNSSTHS